MLDAVETFAGYLILRIEFELTRSSDYEEASNKFNELGFDFKPRLESSYQIQKFVWNLKVTKIRILKYELS